MAAPFFKDDSFDFLTRIALGGDYRRLHRAGRGARHHGHHSRRPRGLLGGGVVRHRQSIGRRGARPLRQRPRPKRADGLPARREVLRDRHLRRPWGRRRRAFRRDLGAVPDGLGRLRRAVWSSQFLHPVLQQPTVQLPAVTLTQPRQQVRNSGIIVMGHRVNTFLSELFVVLTKGHAMAHPQVDPRPTYTTSRDSLIILLF